MIVSCNNKAKEIHYKGHKIKKIVACGNDVYNYDPMYPVPDDVKIYALYSCGGTGFTSLPCTSNKRLNGDDIGNLRCHSTVEIAVVGECVWTLAMGSGSNPIGTFEYLYELYRVDLPSHLNTIEDRCFKDCRKLQTINIKTTTPPTLGANVFDGCIALQHIYVPAESVEAYKTATNWSDKASIIEAMP